jgi:hypothetical protein
MAETTKPIVAKARENIISERPVTSFLSIRMILYRKRKANTTQIIEIFASTISL